jgi:hypothetical protein
VFSTLSPGARSGLEGPLEWQVFSANHCPWGHSRACALRPALPRLFRVGAVGSGLPWGTAAADASLRCRRTSTACWRPGRAACGT